MTDDTKLQDDPMICGLNMAHRDLLQRKLRELPDTPPPRAVWQRIEAQARAEGLFAARRLGQPMKWLAGAAIAAAVALFALRLPLAPEAEVPGNVFSTEPPYQEATGESASVNQLRAVNALMVRSRELESDLRALPEQPQLVQAGTAATILDLEDRIAAIDLILNDSGGHLTAAQSEAYWRERVRLMNSLVRLRYAQAQRSSF
ncbi:MAG TPA: hypothetical protein VLB07_11555 [Woeseiaceae bacterium]|nr:hypothetical protein [Woeseiaceae bacterium]